MKSDNNLIPTKNQLLFFYSIHLQSISILENRMKTNIAKEMLATNDLLELDC